jgi:hypothetical protein
VGYRTPSRAHQFKKDVCPNPLGRGAKNATGAGELFVRVLTEKIIVVDGTKSRSMPRIQIPIEQLGAAAMNGDLDAMEVLIDLRNSSKNGGEFRGDGIERVTVSSDRVLTLQLLRERMERAARRRRR